jgi:hypothetical protein
MKNLMKSVLFAVAMLLAVSVQAENKPENAMRTNPETVATVKTAEPADVQQKPCTVSMTICGRTHVVYVGNFSNNGCNQIQESVNILADLFIVSFGCL